MAGGNGIHWLTGVQCNGNEESILNCQNPGWGVDVYVSPCDHKHDVAVNCGKIAGGSKSNK